MGASRDLSEKPAAAKFVSCTTSTTLQRVVNSEITFMPRILEVLVK